ncbi:atrial natriuretic peptide receptor 1-like isoform X2 [Paramacrobiotus metropolitanus]|uniref:atrial natriuretic peptide receptor 1-like isoform X2 n=1 Tax=Paramacrobiotus metropolitanus TaxID=2943436 RepID=UPI002445C366|nr:atrial natriuretic peptide receptor 1-like isoform X2 [Paramacrobiotus metropolitanus]
MNFVVVISLLFLMFSGIIRLQCSNVTDIRFFIHLPYTQYTYSYEILGPVIDAAFEYVNQKYKGTGLKFSQYRQIYPSIYRCDQTLSVIGQLGAKYYFDYIEAEQDSVPAFFVAACDAVMNFIGDYAREINALFVTSLPADVRLEDKVRFPTLTRFIPYQPQDIAGCISALLSEFSWHRVTVIHETSSAFYSSVGSTVYNMLIWNKDFTPTYFSYDTVSDEDNWKDPEIFLQSAKSFTRVIFLMAPMLEVQKLLVTAYRYGMINEEFVYITIWPFQHDYYGNLSTQYFEPSDIIVRNAFQFLLVVTPKAVNSPLVTNFTMPTINQAAAIKEKSGQKDLHIVDTYSAITEAAKAYFAVWNETGNILDGRAVSQFMWNKTLENDVAGPIFIDPNGDKKVQYAVLSFNQDSGQFEEVYVFDACTITWARVPGKTVTWSGGKVPLDEPVCGYTGNKAVCSQRPENHSAIVWIPITALLLIGSVILHVYTRRKFRHQNDLETAWKLEDAKLFVPFYIGGWDWFSQKGRPQALVSSATMIQGQNSVFPSGHIGYYEQRKVWIKSIDTAKPFSPNNQERHLLREYIKLNHPNVVPFLGLLPGFLCIKLITEYRKRRSLSDLLNNKTVKLDAWLKNSFVNHLAASLTFLHGSTIACHGNLKTPNCIIDNYFILQLTDIDICRSQRTTVLASDVLKLLWNAPEVLRSPIKFTQSKPADLFSFGIVVQELYTECLPYHSGRFTTQEYCTEIVNSVISVFHPLFRWNKWQNCPENVKALIIGCCSESPDERYTIQQVQTFLSQHPEFHHGKSLMDDILDRMEKYANELEEAVGAKTEAFLDEKRKCEQLLSDIFPEAVAKSLMSGNTVYPERYDSVTICFTGINNFPTLSTAFTPNQIVRFLNDLYTIFDAKISDYDVYKVETVADSYIVTSGLPLRNGYEHVRQIAQLARTLVLVGQQFQSIACKHHQLQLKIGFNTGPVATAVVGIRRPRYCIFGDTMNTASRMMSTGEVLKIHVSQSSKDALTRFGMYCELRGTTSIKGKGQENTYWLTAADTAP